MILSPHLVPALRVPVKLSVVVAAWRDDSGLDACLASLAGQREDPHEVLVVADFPPPPDFARAYPGFRWCLEPEDRLIPHLWLRGIDEADGDAVVLTTSPFTPAPDWLAGIGEAHRATDAVGIGGVFDPPHGGSLGDWATFFLRYSPYLNIEAPGSATEIAVDNASYLLFVLRQHRLSSGDGFWEHDYHRRVLAQGHGLRLDPAIRVTLRASFGIGNFCRQRLDHGRQFGASRMANKSWPWRVAGTLALPLIPLILLVKGARRVWKSGRDQGRFLACAPVLKLFVAAWALGEVWGYLTPPGKNGS